MQGVENIVTPKISKKECETKTETILSFSYFLVLFIIFTIIYSDNLPFLYCFGLSLACSGPAAIIFLIIANPLNEKLKKNSRPSIKGTKKAMIDRLKSFYLPDNNIELLKTLYERSLLKRDQKKKIEQFLAINGKTVMDYLNSLGNKNLVMLAAPYRDQINKDINEAVESYFIGKSRDLELQIMAENSKKNDEERFKEDCLKLFYSTMPKNIAKHKDICSEQEKSLLKLVKAQA